MHTAASELLLLKNIYISSCSLLGGKEQYVTGYGKRAHFAHYFKIELLVFKDSVDLKQ